LFQYTLNLELGLRLGVTLLVLAPAGFLMGSAFPGGVAWLEKWAASEHIPWVWAANGAASVISAVLAALLALSWGFNFVFLLGALCYAGAWLAIRSTRIPLDGD
jgi:MFS family permease